MSHLNELWNRVDDCEDCATSYNQLQHILGGGEENNPKIMFVFINPTRRNIASSPEYTGPRFPFIGTKEVWRVFFNAGLFPAELMEQINHGNWSKGLIDSVLNFLKESGFYFTNVSKCCNSNATLPDNEKILKGKKILFEEISIVNPKLIVAFGLIPIKAITVKNIKLQDYINSIRNKIDEPLESTSIFNKSYPVVPCYFPVGRGNPKKAVEILKHITDKYLMD